MLVRAQMLGRIEGFGERFGSLTPQKIRHFTWKACRDILPTKVNLVRRRVLTEDVCDGCKLAPKNSNNYFWSCKFASKMWERSKLALPIEPN